MLSIDVSNVVLESNKFSSFNEMQQMCVEKGFEKNMVVSAPTASGKTIVAELFMLEQAYNQRKKVIYTCPLRALASEHYYDFKKKYPALKFALSTGDLDSNSSYLKKFDVIFTTYEKLASLLRHDAEWLKQVGCLIVDEIHELDSDRGPVLEVAITQLRNLLPELKILGLSATIPNAKELSEWLEAELVESTFRPVKLKEGVMYNKEIVFNDGSNETGDLEKVVQTAFKENKQILLFMNSRKRAEGTAKKLCIKTPVVISSKEQLKLDKLSEEILSVLEQPTEQCQSLSNSVKKGVAFHHAGLMQKQRSIVEENFRNGLIKVISATPTLCVVPETELWQGTLHTMVKNFCGANSRILALKNNKIVSVRPKQILKNCNGKKIVEIESNAGHKIRVTENHKMLIKRKGKKKFIPAIGVEKTDKIATVGRLWKNRSVKYKLNYFTKDNEKTNLDINSQIAYFIGAMLGDGNSGADIDGDKIIYKSNPTIINGDMDLFEEIKKACKNLNIYYKLCTNTYGTKYLRLTKQNWFREFLVRVGVEVGNKKHVCDELKLLGSKETSALLQGLFDTDGSVERKKQLTFSNISLQLIKDVQRLLLTFGIVARVRKRKGKEINIYGKRYSTKDNYELIIANKKSVLNFFKYVGFRIKRKQLLLEEVVQTIFDNILYVECTKCGYKIYADLFKGRTKNQKNWGCKKLAIINLLGKEKKLSSNQIKHKLGFTPYKSEKRLNHHFELIKRTRKGNVCFWELNKIGKKIYCDINESKEWIINNYGLCPICGNKGVQKIRGGWRDNDFEEDIYWDFVRTKKIIKEKYEVVYDISLSSKNTDNLFVANGFIVHNSAGVNTPADIVLIPSLYRFEKYGMNLISKREYKQMSGRSGRPKFSSEGKSIVCANSEMQRDLYFEEYINGDLEPIQSRLSIIPILRTHILALIATNQIYDLKSAEKFFEKTLYAVQLQEMSELLEKVMEIIHSFELFGFVEKKEEKFVITPIGKRVSDLFLDPESAYSLIQALSAQKPFTPLSYLFTWANCLEFSPWLRVQKKAEPLIWEELNERAYELPFKQEKLLFEPESLEKFFSALMLEQWINEKKEQELFTDFGVAPGALFGKNRIIEWLAYSTIELSKVLGLQQHLIPSNKLSKRVKYGVKEELLPLVELKGIGRARARKLYQAGITRPSEVKKNLSKIESILGKKVSLILAKQLL